MVKHPVFLSPFEEYGVISVGGRGDASGENKPLPSPLEVDRFISVLHQVQARRLRLALYPFRPLAR